MDKVRAELCDKGHGTSRAVSIPVDKVHAKGGEAGGKVVQVSIPVDKVRASMEQFHLGRYFTVSIPVDKVRACPRTTRLAPASMSFNPRG